MVSQHPDEKAEAPRLQRLGVWGSTPSRVLDAIPTKTAEGHQSDIGKVAPAHRWTGAPYRIAPKWFNVPPPVFLSPKIGHWKYHYHRS